MSQLSKIPPSESSKLSLKQYGSIVLAELPTEQVVTTIAGLLHDLAKLYQIQNWDISNSAHLGSWILRNYKYEQLQSIVDCLQNPPEIFNDKGEKERIWRLTPDTVRAWLAAHLDKLCDAREKEIEEQKKTRKAEDFEPLSEETQSMIQETLNRLKSDPLPSTPKLDLLKEVKRKETGREKFVIEGIEIMATSKEEAEKAYKATFE